MTCALPWVSPDSDAMRVYAQIWVFRSAPEPTFQTEAKAVVDMCIGLALQEGLHHSAGVNRLTHIQDVSPCTSMCSYGGCSTYSRSELRVRLLSLLLLGHFIFSFCLVFAELQE